MTRTRSLIVASVGLAVAVTGLAVAMFGLHRAQVAHATVLSWANRDRAQATTSTTEGAALGARSSAVAGRRPEPSASAPTRGSSADPLGARGTADRLRELAAKVPATSWRFPAPPSAAEEARVKAAGFACLEDGECKADESCGFDFARPGMRCLKSDCSADNDCPGEQLCKLAAMGQRPLRRCASPGPRLEGEACKAFRTEEECGAGLFCLANVCERTCEAGCTEGEACVDFPKRTGSQLPPAMCMPSCVGDADCAARELGDRCIEVEGLNFCRRKVGSAADCLRTPCGEGEVCHTEVGAREVSFRCVRRCNPLDADSCAQGEMCGAVDHPELSASGCFTSCSGASDDCGEGEACTSTTEEPHKAACYPVAL
jgi:hypothetical protein